MVFSSVPAYLDPSNWQPQQPESGGEHENPPVSPLLQPPPPFTGGGGGGIGKPDTMSDRSRLAKLPRPEIALKCPRCESTNTKFCYFNNYNLSQPRHFCKTCRRYWTRGGALRNVPVGGGCRRNNKRSKGGCRSKSPATSSPRMTAVLSPNRCTTDNISYLALPPPKLPFLPSLHHLNTDHGAGDVGLTFGGIQTATAENDIDLMNIGSNSQWRMQQMQQFPFLETPTAGMMYPFESEGPSSYARGVTSDDHFGSRTVESGVTQVDGGIKMEENHQGLNLSKRFLGILGTDHNPFWGITNAWNITSEYATSSANHAIL